MLLLALNYSTLPGVRPSAFDYAEVLLMIDLDVLAFTDPQLCAWVQDARTTASQGETIEIDDADSDRDARMYEALVTAIEAGVSCIKVVRKETLLLAASVAKIHGDLDRMHAD